MYGDLILKVDETPINKTTGYIINNGTKIISVNMSSIYTELIHNAGRWCERYASDLFIDLHMIQNNLDNAEYVSGETYCTYFGFREDGVDGEIYIKQNLKNMREQSYYYYRKIMMLEIKVNENNVCANLYKCSITHDYSLRK